VALLWNFASFRSGSELEELDPCPCCLETAALALEHADALLCFHCGYIRARDVETSVRELQVSMAPRVH
jgi:ribosomal protein S27AE